MTLDFEVPDELIPCNLELEGMDGNAGAIIGNVRRGLRDIGNSREVIDWYVKESMSGDYHHLLRVAMVATGML